MTSDNTHYIGAIVAILAIAGVGSIFAEDPATLLALCGSGVIGFLTLLTVANKTHEAVNSKMERLLTAVDEAAFHRGERANQARQDKHDITPGMGS